MTAHLHPTDYHGTFWLEQLLFRDFLRTHSDVARKCKALKRTLSSRYGAGPLYSAAKTELTRSAVERAWRPAGLPAGQDEACLVRPRAGRLGLQPALTPRLDLTRFFDLVYDASLGVYLLAASSNLSDGSVQLWLSPSSDIYYVHSLVGAFKRYQDTALERRWVTLSTPVSPPDAPST